VIRIRAMTAEDVPVVLHLRELAGWNQREADVRRLLDLEPDGCFLAEWAGRPAGTATTCVFGPVAWVAMVLVEPALRGRGIGTALMEHALAYLDRRQVPTVRLDATPLGQPIYEKLGFVTEYRLARYQGKLPAGEPLAQLEPVRPEQLEEVARLDREVTSTDRRKLLFRLFEERPGEMRMVRRDGRVDAEAGPLLLADACRRHAGEAVFLDIPEDNRPATALAAEWGLTVQRHLLRMVRGVPIREDVGQLWASSGPEKG
jgi:GNAT superfamily N-acetyltransferase